jgi:hypothetical protein
LNPLWKRVGGLLHQQHLARTFNDAIETPLIVGGEARVFAGQNPALVRGKLSQQGGVFEIEGFYGEIDLGFRTGRPLFNHR